MATKTTRRAPAKRLIAEDGQSAVGRVFATEVHEENAAKAAAACAKGTCKPYVGILTGKRWVALGYVPRKGEKGTKIKTARGGGYVVFCKHQVTKLNP